MLRLIGRNLPAFALVGAMAACSHATTGQLDGRVSLNGNVPPVAARPLAAGRLRVIVSGQSLKRTVAVSKAGRFSLRLPPGHYSLSLPSVDCATNATVTAGHTSGVTVECLFH